MQSTTLAGSPEFLYKLSHYKREFSVSDIKKKTSLKKRIKYRIRKIIIIIIIITIIIIIRLFHQIETSH